MANLARNASVETDYGLTLSDVFPWSFRTPFEYNSGEYAIQLQSSVGVLVKSPYVEWEITTAALPQSLTVSIAYKENTGNTANSGVLRLRMDPDGDGIFTTIESITTGTGLPSILRDTWRRYTFSSVVITTPHPRVRIQAVGGVAAGTWYVDDIIVEGTPVAVKLAERALDEIVTLMQANLATELTAIDTDRGDGVTLAAPANANYYKREKPVIDGPDAHVEVFESDWEFTNPYTDADAQRAVYDLPVVLRLTFFARNGDSADTMRKRKQRYAAGLFNVINKNSRLNATDSAIKNAVIESVRTDLDRDEQDNINKGRVTLGLLVKCEEVQ